MTLPLLLTAISLIVNEWKAEQRTLLESNIARQYIVQNADTLKFHTQVFGLEPADGRSLWISMHGGGGCPAEVNNQQWRNQTLLYRPSEGVYICPRAPWDAWNMWFQAPIDSLFEELIRTMVVCYNVNPNKVYIMGYSAGGDGVWRLAPRLADHWAAAAMMAGHPGDVSLKNLYNLPLTIWCGGADDAYNRNVEVAARGVILDSLQAQEPQGYIHETNILPGMPHWMYQRDTVAVRWMQRYTRNPHPKHIVWQQEDVLRPTFYWLEVPRHEMQRGKTIIATIEGNTIHLERCDYEHLTLYLSPDMVDFKKKVTVQFPDGHRKKFKLKPSDQLLRSTLQSRGDPAFIFPAKIAL